jgi:methoxymalonate biosynthesis acyl carrier protein
MLPINEVKTRTRAFMSRHFKGQTVEDHDDIFALGFVNSLFAIQLVRFVEQEFDVTVDNEDLDVDNFRSIDAVAGFVHSKTAAARGEAGCISS